MCSFSELRTAPLKRVEVELAVLHRLDVGVLAVHGDRPEADVGGGRHVEDELVGVEHRDVAAAAGGAPVEGDLQFLTGHGLTSPPRRRRAPS